MKLRKLTIYTACLLLLGSSACSYFEVEDVKDPNRAAIDTIVDPNATQLTQLAVGVVAQMRNSFRTNAPYNQVTGVLGREIYVLASNDQRWYQELMGAGSRQLDNNAFYSAAAYNQFALTRKGAQTLLEAGQRSTSITNAGKSGINGFSHTIQAWSMLHLLNLMGENGIRINLTDPMNPGPFVSYTASLTEIRRLLDLGANELKEAGPAFVITLPNGFTGFNTPANFLKFNRALTARVAAYQQDWPGVLAALNESFLNLNATTAAELAVGPVHTFAAAPDVFNPYHQIPNTAPATLVVVHPSFVTDAEAGDRRVMQKAQQRTTSFSLGGLTGTHDPILFVSNTSPLSIIRNEELILLYAEASIQNNQLENGENALNVIRKFAGGVPDYSGPDTKEALIDEMLKQRRYSLWYEGHRWVDMRRYNRLNLLPIDRVDDDVWDRLRIPFNETAWDASR